MQNSKKNSTNYMEKLFQDMRALPPYEKRGLEECKNPFSDEVINGWYSARKYVLEQLSTNKDMGAEGIPPSSSDRVHVVIFHKGPMALYVARQVALVAHFPNFKEGDGKKKNSKNCTKITILYNRIKHPDILKELEKDEYLCNLPKVCKCSFVNDYTETINKQSYIDIELELVAFNSDEEFENYRPKVDAGNNLEPVIIDEYILEQITQCDPPLEIDIRNASRVNMVYGVGADIDNLPPDTPNTAERYDMALSYFCYQQSSKETMAKWEGLSKGKKDSLSFQINLRKKLSNVFCNDCFSTRFKSVLDKPDDLMNQDEKELLCVVKDNIQLLAQCEHARWNVEELILGFSPLTPEERWKDAQLFGEARKAYRKELKNKGHHIDLCSCQDLRRINPADRKYDYFLMLAMVKILKETAGIE